MQLSDEIVAEFLASLETASTLVHPSMQDLVSVIVRDPDDDPILQTAMAGNADVLCALDRHFYENGDTRRMFLACSSLSGGMDAGNWKFADHFLRSTSIGIDQRRRDAEPVAERAGECARMLPA